VEPLKKNYQLILIDVRGHGSSDKAHRSQAYKLETLVTDVVRVLDDHGVNKAHFMGYSMGGWIGFGIAKHALGRFKSLIIGGASPYADPSELNHALEFYNKILKMPEPARWEFALASFEKTLGPRLTPQMRTKWIANDLEALIALVSTEDWMLDLGNILPTIRIPCLIFAGEADTAYSGAKKCAESIPNAIFVSFPNLGHIETRYRSDLVLPHVVEFLESVERTY
jgi:pimeloyl-ACP methyl ester carboxylesterase